MRKETEITIETGRDAGKKFKITEMPATQGEKWSMRALGVLGHSGLSITSLGKIPFETIIEKVMSASPEEVEPLMDELLACASFEKDGAIIKMQGNMVDSVIEDISTIFRLKAESLELNLGFLGIGGESESI